MRAIAHELGRSLSTIKRELDRHRDEHGRYLPQTADHAARQQRHRPRQHKLLTNPRLRKLVQCKLKPLLVTRPDQRLAAPQLVPTIRPGGYAQKRSASVVAVLLGGGPPDSAPVTRRDSQTIWPASSMSLRYADNCSDSAGDCLSTSAPKLLPAE
jgi:hypothetical protein